MDWTSFLDMLDDLRANGITAIGIDRAIDEARKPAIINVKGTRIGFLTRNAVNNLPAYHADVGKPSTAPLRIYTSYAVISYEINKAVGERFGGTETTDSNGYIKVIQWSCKYTKGRT